MFLEFKFLLVFFANKCIDYRRKSMFRFHPLPQSPAFYWPADKAVTHAQMRDVMVWKRERDSEVINISLLSQRKYYNGFLFSQKQPFEMKRETSSGNERYSSKRNGKKMAALSLFSWASLPKIYSTKFLQYSL